MDDGFPSEFDTAPAEPGEGAAWSRPSFEVIALDCEITAYAPDGDDPRF